MALNKAKTLKNAEKYVIQGKISNAIAEYQKLIKEDPTDLPLVNTLGDLHVRIGNIPEAVKCFSRLAESYDNGGFVVRAIAMYKKVCKTDPTQVIALARLADLYLRQGLVSESRAHYLMVVDNYLKRGATEEAAGILRKAIDADPDNPVLEGRLAELNQQLGKQAEAAAAFYSAGVKLRKKGLLRQAHEFLEKAIGLDPTNILAAIGLAEVLSELGEVEEALTQLNQIPFSDLNPEVLEASFNIYLRAGRLAEAERAATHAMEVDASHFRLWLALAKANSGKGDFYNAIIQIGKVIRVAIERGEGHLIESELKALYRQNPDYIPTLVELVRYYDQANEPHNAPSYLEKIADILVRNDQLDDAARIYQDLINREPNEPSHRENLKRLIDRGVNAELPERPNLAQEEFAGRSEPGPTPIENLINEADLFAGYGQYQRARELYQKVLDGDPNHLEAHQKILEVYLKLDAFSDAAQTCLNLYALHTMRGEAEEASRYFKRAQQLNPDIGHATAIPNLATEEAAAPTASGSDVLQGLLEEIDFYLDQNFLAEARNSLRKYQELAPYDSQLKRRQAQLETLASKSAPSQAAADEGHIDLTGELTAEEFETSSPRSAAPASIPAIAGYESHSPEQQAPPATSRASDAHSPATEAPAESSFAALMKDMSEDLKGVIQDEPAAAAPEEKHRGEGAGLKDIFDDFKAEFEDDETEAVDFETHYTLGIAYKEMTLVDEAIAEFQKALQDQRLEQSSENFVRACNMLGLCFLEKALPQVAIKWFTKGLESPGHMEDTYQALRYDLGCAHEMAGDKKAALETFLDIYGININYRDVADKIEQLKASP